MSNAPAREEDGSADHDHELIDRAQQQIEQAPKKASGGAFWPPLTLPSPDSLPGYEIVREVHRGGQGVVYEAVQVSTRRTVAVKVLLEEPFASERARWRFKQEVKLVAALRHPNIIIIHDSGIAHGKYYFAMDYVRGEPLDTHVRLTQPPLRTLILMFRQVCDAIAYAHRRGVIHRDLKPSNILISPEGVPCVLDFGLAKIISDEMQESERGPATVAGNLMGTLRYMSPEQTLGNPDAIDIRTDVYTLGVLIYESLTGGPPYSTGADLSAAIRNIREADPLRPSRFRREIGSDLETIVLKAIAKEPERRYQSAGELNDDLGAWLDGRPISARSSSSFYVVRKLAVRHGFETLVITAMLLAIGGFSAIGIQLHSSEREAQTHQQQSEQAYTEKNLGLTEFHRDASDFLRVQALGWFLLEWNQDHLERAQELASKATNGSPERAVMSFLLDVTSAPDQLLAALPPEMATLAHFAAGERYLKTGRETEAVRCFVASISSAGPRYEWVRQAAQAGLTSLHRSNGIVATVPSQSPG